MTKGNSQRILLLCLILLYSNCAFTNPGAPTIISVSTSLDAVVSAQGSVEGGTQIYIKGTNFDPIAANNRITVGPYPCNLVADGANENTLSCITTAATDPSYQSSLAITVTVQTVFVACNSNNCKYTYTTSVTPFIDQIIPRSVISADSIYVFGSHRIANLGDGRSPSASDIKYFTIGGNLCSMLDVVQNQDDYNPNWRSAIQCKSDVTQVAGQYDFTELTNYGTARKSYRTSQTSLFTGANYTQRVAAKVNYMSSHQGGSQGQLLTIKGSGFSKDTAAYGCKIAGQTCSVVSAGPTQLTVKVPVKAAGNTGFDALTKDASDTSSQINPYLGTQGALYKRYDRESQWKDGPTWLTYLRGTPTIALQQQKVITQLGSPQAFGSNYVEYVRGYFSAPIDGIYKFSALSDDFFYMQFSSVKNNANPTNLQQLLLQQNHNNNHFVSFVRENSTQSQKSLTLTAGQYYFQLVNVNYGGAGYFKVQVQTPSNHATTINPVWQVDRIRIKPSQYTAQVITVKVFAASGSFDLFYYDSSNYLYLTSVNIGTSADDFKSALYNLPNLGNYGPTVTLTKLDVSGNPTTDPALVQGYQYTITYDRYRPASATGLPYTRTTKLVASANKAVSINVALTATHSPPLSGTFTLSVAGTALQVNSLSNLNYNVESWQIQSALNKYYNSRQIKVYRVMNTYTTDSIEFVIEYVGIQKAASALTADLTLLQGGNTGTSPTATIQTVRPYSATRELYTPVPFQFLNTASSLPTLRLTLNSIPAVCWDCSYQFNTAATPVVTSSSRSTSTLSLSLSDPLPLGFILSDITVTYLDAPCLGLTGTRSSFTCTLPLNTDTTVAIPAGSAIPVVHVNQIGFASTSGLTAQVISISVTSVTPAQTSPGGGIQASIVGAGFPISSSTGLTVSVCGNTVTQFTTISNQLIKFIVPSQVTTCSGSNNAITYNSQTASFVFSYNPSISPSITSLSKTSSSPILKSSFTITGTNFGTTSTTKVYLAQNNVNIYQLGITAISSTSITAVLGGGKTGEYDVVVVDSTNGKSTPSASSKFNYKIVITGLSISSGHIGGGYALTITGYNFATGTGTNNVFIGDAKNSICLITAQSSTSITCTVPRMLDDYTVSQSLDVVVTGRIIQQSLCQGTCTFSYVNTGSTVITLPTTTTYKAGDSVTVTATSGLSGVTSVKVNNIVCNISPLSTDTSLTFTYPALAAGSYQAVISVGNGWTYPQFITSTGLSIDSATASTTSVAGMQLGINGNGFPSSGIYAWFVCSSTNPLTILSSTTTRINILIPPFNTDTNCKVNVTIGTTFSLFNLAYQYSSTCDIALSGSNLSYTFAKNNLTAFTPTKAQLVYLDSNNNPTSSRYTLTISGTSLTSAYLPAGNYKVYLHSSTHGYALVTPPTVTVAWKTAPSISGTVTTSFVGGKNMVISGQGFVTNNVANNEITVCGLKANIISASTTQAVIAVPALVTTVSQTAYSLASVGLITTGTYFGDSAGSTAVGDNSFNTQYSSANAQCWVGVDFGSGIQADVSSIKYVPNPTWPIAATKLQSAIFQGSNDGTSYTTIFTIDTSQVHSGWNTWNKATGTTIKYRYIRFKHTSVSSCQLAEIQVYGIAYSTLNVVANTDYTCDVNVKAGSQLLSSKVTYSHASTSVVSGVSPVFGPVAGGDVVTITGTGFSTAANGVTVTIDGVACAVSSNTATQIVCTTGLRSTPPSTGNTFVVLSDGNYAKIATSPFLYMDRWSSTSTWGGQAVPRQGDSVYVPKGMTLLVDQSTPILNTVIVQGKIQFDNVNDITFDAHYFLIKQGQFQAGTQTNRYTKKLTITLHGDYYGKQLPTFGNKVLGCLNCKFNMHGIQRPITWTQLQTTITPGDITFKVVQAVDWVAGQKIAIASTSFDHYQSEQRQILSITPDGLYITVTQPFSHRHFAGVQTFDGTDIVMRAQVGLLTRNILVKGNDQSVDTQYGSHLMFNGRQAKGLQGRVSYVQFTKCGQPKIVGRYCTHFHMAGQVPNSYIKGIAVHHSFARVLTIHGTHFLTIQKSVGFHVKGHNIFIQDGIQTNNVIQDNLMISSIASMTMLQSDTSVASYWITNPYNTVRRNHAAGGDFYGFWYEIKEHPDGPSATSDICPEGMQLGISRDNVAHSNRRFGLRIFRLSARKYPCVDTEDQSALDPYIGNPAIQSVFTNYTLWKNQECGFLGQQLGFTTIDNFKTIDSRKGGLQFHKTNFTKQLVVAKNSVVVGYSIGNGPVDLDTQYNNARGVIAARTDGLKFSGIRFYNFGPTMTPLQSCSQCWNFKLWVTGGKTTLFQNIQYTNIQGSYIFWQKWRRQIFIDLDGTMSAPFRTSITPAIATQSKAVITPYRPSLMIPSHCYRDTNNLWNNSIYCDSTVTLRGILFTNPGPLIDFNAVNITVHLLSSPTQLASSIVQATCSYQPMIIIKKSHDIKNSWAMPFATGQYYNVHWKWGIDFTHMAIAPSRLWQTTDGVVLRFNYTDNRQLFQIGKWYQQQLQKPFITPSLTLIDPTTCNNGQYFHDVDNKYLYVCVTGRNKTIRQWTDLNGIKCLNFCPTQAPTAERQKFSRLWSNVSQWPSARLPLVNQNVTIPYQWNLVLDIDPPVLNYVKVDGILIFDRARDNKFQAHYIWVNKGIIRIGAEDSPFSKQANIILHGNKDDNYLVIDPNASGNKMLAVTGGLQFYGTQPQTVWTRLTKTAIVGSNKLQVKSAAGWKVGDSIVVAPTYAGRKQFEQFTISAISGNVITLNSTLVYEHYGALDVTISNNYGVLDTRAAVGILTRNIKISPAADPNGWGCRVLVYGYNEIQQDLTKQPIWRNGYAKLHGVQIDRCGQYDTTYAALRFQNLGVNADKPNNVTSEVVNSVIHGCGAFCTYIKQVSNLTIDNNVYFYARKFLVYVEQVISLYNFTNNVLIGARKRDQMGNLDATKMVDDVAGYEQYFTIDFAADHRVNVSNNLVQGSQGQGFVFPSTKCDLIATYPFINNTAGSCEVAFMYEKMESQTCLAAKGCIGYASQIGLMANMPGSHIRVQYSNMFFADNQRGITLRYAHEIDDNSLIFKDSYITGVSRPTCPTCYTDSTIKYCNGGYAVRMLATTISGQTFPLKKKATGHDVICTQESFDARAYLDNVTFQNYFTTNAALPLCKNMAVFRRHNIASDGTGSHYLTNTKCVNCDQTALAHFEQPNVGWRGWFGGCGLLDCTGPNNYFIHDQDGTYTGVKSQLLANNSMIGDHDPSCTSVPEWNGHWCKTQQFAVMEYQSIAPDFNKRMMWPVYLQYDGGAWNTTTNGWRQWGWQGSQPLNTRLARFWSVIKLHESYNLTYSSQPPSDSRFQIQKRLMPSGNANDWAVIRIYYPLPNSLEVRVKNSTGSDILVKPFPVKSGVAEDLRTYTSVCGANNFYYQNGTIQFVVNGKNNCQVRVRLSSFIQLSARIDIPIASFYTNNGPTSFITNICAFLGIDTGRMKIVSIKQGSVVVVAVIQTDSPALSASTTPTDSQTTYSQLNLLNQKLQSGLTNNQISLGATLLQFSSDAYVINPDGSQYAPTSQQLKDNKKLVIILAVVIPSVILLAVVSGYCYWKRKRAQIHQLAELGNKSSIGREHIKGSTEFQISSAVDQFTVSKYSKKWGGNGNAK